MLLKEGTDVGQPKYSEWPLQGTQIPEKLTDLPEVAQLVNAMK